jgi:hypothetical protein
VAHSSESMSLLVIVDESPEANRAVSYVAKLIGRRRGFHIVLVHLLPPLPPDASLTGVSGPLRIVAYLEAAASWRTVAMKVLVARVKVRSRR